MRTSRSKPFSIHHLNVNDSVKYRNEMPKELKQKWVDALRSGKYEQGEGQLYDRDNKCYCVMGVLGRVGGLHPNQMKDKDILPRDWCESQGITFPSIRNCPIVQFDDENKNMISLNDTWNVKFDEFANLIESQVKGV
jgi:hypothetical protein